MKTNIQSVHFDADRKLLDFIETKLNKLASHYDSVIESEVTLRLDKADNNENKIVEIRMAVRGNDLFAKKQCKTFEEATDLCAEALKTQLEKHKDKIRQN
jgi:putative sigma-54 modulation protein